MIGYGAHTAARQGRDNQDRWSADLSTGRFVVADGMGGLADAAATAEAVVRLLSGTSHDDITARGLSTSLVRVSEHIRDTARYGPGNAGAAVAMVAVRGGIVTTAHLGDCRVVLIRKGQLVRLTSDHLAGDGTLTQFAGMQGDVHPAAACLALHAGDRLVLGSDGLSVLPDDEFVVALDAAPSPTVACADLVARARRAGTTDDVTAVVVTIEDARRWRWDESP